jgi:hypothetical protein
MMSRHQPSNPTRDRALRREIRKELAEIAREQKIFEQAEQAKREIRERPLTWRHVTIPGIG